MQKHEKVDEKSEKLLSPTDLVRADCVESTIVWIYEIKMA